MAQEQHPATHTKRRPEPAMTNKLKVLFVEDDKNDFELVQRELQDVAEVESAKDKQSFLTMLNQKKFDVVLVDFSLPTFSGVEAMEILKEKDVPIILVTGSIDHRTASSYLRSGAVDYFLKNDLLENSLARLSDAVLRAHENHNLRKQLLRDNRLELVGHLQAGFNHDLRNLLQVFVSGTDILRKLIQDRLSFVPDDIGRVLDAMSSTGIRGTDMSNQISAFIRGTNGNVMKSVRPEYLLTEIGAIMRESFPPSICRTTHVVPGTFPVKCDATQIIQVLLNLAVNARDEMKHGGELHITAQNTTFNEMNLRGDFVVFQIRDTGNGIPPENMQHIWEPFWTSKSIGQGTGLGLPMAQKIARHHGGDIDVKTGSAGTSFFVYLPAAVEETRAEAVTRMEEFDGQGKTVVYVDDEQHMLLMVEMFLSDANYKVLVASSGMEALSIFRSNQDISALLTDCGMPVLSGQQLAETLRGQSYTLPIIYMTGATDAEQFDPAPDLILRKPFTRFELLSALAKVLLPA
jgi:signal transduction histidine kinase